MKKQISRLFLAVFMITALLFCMNMTAFAEIGDNDVFTNYDGELIADNYGSGSDIWAGVVVTDPEKTDINEGDKLVVTDSVDVSDILNAYEQEYIEVVGGGSMAVLDENDNEKVVGTTADFNTNDIPLDYDIDDDGCITTYVSQYFEADSLYNKDVIVKSVLANPGIDDNDPLVQTISPDDIQQVGYNSYEVYFSFEGIRNWILGLVDHVISFDYNMHEITSNEEMLQKGVNEDINLLTQKLPEGSWMFGIPDDGAKLFVAGSMNEYAKKDASGNPEMEPVWDEFWEDYVDVVVKNNTTYAQIAKRLQGVDVSNTYLDFYSFEELEDEIADAANQAAYSGVYNAFLALNKRPGEAFDGCAGGYFYYDENPGTGELCWNYGCNGGAVSYGWKNIDDEIYDEIWDEAGEEAFAYWMSHQSMTEEQFEAKMNEIATRIMNEKAEENGWCVIQTPYGPEIYESGIGYYVYTMDHADLTADNIHFELKDKDLLYMPRGAKDFTKDDVEVYFIGADGQKVYLDFYEFVDSYMNGTASDGSITINLRGIYKTLYLGEQAKPFFFTPSTVSELIKFGYYPAFLSNENGAASFTIDFAQDAANPENNTIYITAEPNADGKFEPTTMQFNSTLISHLNRALVSNISLTMGNNEVVVSYASLAELLKKYDGVSFSLTVDGDKVTATIMNKQGIVTDVTSELEMTVNKK